MFKKNSFYLSLIFLISSCGGGGGGGGDTQTPTTPLPSISFSADPTSQLINNNVTLSWSSSNANSCSASGSWSGTKTTAGTEIVQITGVGNNSFTLSCSGSGGNRSSTVTVEGYRETDGVVVDGYISGAEVCIDENSNFLCDSSEFSTTSDNDGKFKLRYIDGSLVSIGGTDLDSQIILENYLISHKMTGYTEFKVVTPVTSVASFLCTNNGTCDGSGANINTILGFDNSIDIYTFDPVANRGDGGIYDFLYEKGNQLTILALSLQNITNNLNNITETTQDYFKAIAEELDKEYSLTSTKVDIETESFIQKVLENLINNKSISIDETLKQNTITSLAGVLPIIQVKSDNNLTTSIIRFGLSTLQNDIVSIANGSASEDLLNSYTSNIIEYIAQDQGIGVNEITPDVTAVDDAITLDEDTNISISVLTNDSYITSAPISISSISQPTNGVVSLSDSLDQVFYVPDTDFNGSDSFIYTILQGGKSSSAQVSIEVSAVNDEPSIDIASTILTPENKTNITSVSISDVDGDELTLTMDGSDADSFNLSADNLLSFKETPDYESNKISYNIRLNLTDGIESVSKDISINLTNILEDFISHSWDISDGTMDQAPVLTASLKMDSLSNIDRVYLLLNQVSSAEQTNCTGRGSFWKSFEMIKESSTDWSLSQALSDETSDLCSYTVSYALNFHDIDQETSPPTDGVHLQSNNKAILNDNTLQLSTYFTPSSGNDLKTISNPKSDDEITKYDDKSLFLYLESQNYPEQCSIYQYDLSITDPVTGSVEELSTPVIALINDSCVGALTENTSSDNDKVLWNYSFYSLEPIDHMFGYVFSAQKATTLNDNRAFLSRELLSKIASISSANPRIANISFEFDKSFLPASYSSFYDIPRLFIYAYDESGFLINNTAAMMGVDSFPYVAGDEADITPPILESIKSSSYTNSEYPQRNFIKFEAEVTNDATTGALTSIKDIWFTITGGPECTTSTIYIRDEMDGKLDVTTTSFTATIPFLKSQEGTYRIQELNINDWGYAENSYPDYEWITDKHESIGTDFTVGDGTAVTCPFFSYGEYVREVSVEENVTFIGDFPASGGSSDTITYELQYPDGYGDNSIVDLVQIDSNGTLTFIDPPDEESDVNSSGIVEIVARSSINTNLTDSIAVRVGITDMNDSPPEIVGLPVNADENQTDVGCIVVTDADVPGTPSVTPGSSACPNPVPMTYSIEVDDPIEGGTYLTISDTGRLSFASAPDYEIETSLSGTVTVSDGVASASEFVTIQINDVNDNAPIIGNSSFTINENISSVGQISVSDLDTNNSFTFEIVSDFEDGSLFRIDSEGNIYFISNPDYETQATYKIKVNVSDGAFTVTQEFTINLNDVIAEAIPTSGDLNLLPKTTNSLSIQLQSYVIDGRSPSFSVETDGIYGSSSVNETSGELNYDTSYTDVAIEEITFKVSDGTGNESTAKLTINLNTDPLYKYQWHLENTGQTNFASTAGIQNQDLNTTTSISSGYTGKDLIVSVLDSGLEIAHEDLSPNVLSGKSYNFVTGSNDPTSEYVSGDHGTSVAGIIASKGWNNIGGRGVAPDANLVGYNYLRWGSSSNQAFAWGLDNSIVSADIFNMSYGVTGYSSSTGTFSFPTGNLPNTITNNALINGVNNLRGGKGGIYVKSMGNGFRSYATNGTACGEEGVDDDGAMGCTTRFQDVRHTIPYIIAVGALGADGIKSSYSTTDPSIWVSGTGGEYGINQDYWGSDTRTYLFEPAIMTTDQSSCDVGYVSQYSSNRNAFNDSSNPHPDNPECKYTSRFNGTSSAAPSVAGAIAVLLEAYPDLTWREVKHVIANSARKVDEDRSYTRSDIVQYEWETNAAGYHFHNWYGFGAFDLDSALDFASSYTLGSLGTFNSYGWSYSPEETQNQLIPSFSLIDNTISYNPSTTNNFVEYIQLAVYLTKDTPRDLGIMLVSPQGTEMNILQPFTNISGNPNGSWSVIGVNGFYGENITGDWKLKIIDYTDNDDEGTLNNWAIRVWGN